MNFWTVQCSFASYDAKTVVVEAETVEQALDRAIVAANEGDGWSSLDVCGGSFVDAVAEGQDADPWTDFASALPVPARFTERGEPRRIQAARRVFAAHPTTPRCSRTDASRRRRSSAPPRAAAGR